MNTSLRDFLNAREAEINQQIELLSNELREIQIAREAVEGGGSLRGTTALSAPRLTIKDMIRDVLKGRPEGGVADQIIEWVKEAHGVGVPRSSMSPQLSRLKAEGLLHLNNSTKVWRLVEYVTDYDGSPDLLPNENGASESASEADAEDVAASSASMSATDPEGQTRGW